MKAAVVKGRRLVAYEEVPTPSAQPGTLLLKMKYCCVCGSELEYVDNQRAPQNPIVAGGILGHEFVAEVAEVGVDMAFVCVRRGGNVLKQAFDMVRVQGRVILAGYTESVKLDTTSWLRKQVRIEGSLNRGAKMATALKLLEYKRVNVKPLITEIIPLKDVQRAFDSMYGGENIGVLLKP